MIINYDIISVWGEIEMNRIIMFDGECNFCNKSVQFIIKRDPKGLYKFTSLQSSIGKELLKKYNLSVSMDSFILIENNNYYFKSSAGLRVCRNLKGMWKLFYFLLIVPKPLRDIFYEHVANKRYKWFGTRETCILPSTQERERFL